MAANVAAMADLAHHCERGQYWETCLYKHLLTAINLEKPSDVPLQTGLRLAAEYVSALRAVSAVRSALLVPKGFFHAETVDKDEILEEARRALRSRVEHLGSKHLDFDVLVGKPSEVIANAAEYHGSDLIVMGAHPRSTSEMIFGTTATNVLRLARHADIYACHRTDPDEPVRRILVAVDGSSLTPHVLFETEHLMKTSLTAEPVDVRIVCVVKDDRQSPVADAFHQFVAASGLANEPHQVVTGGVVPCLEEMVAEFDADLLVVGSGRHLGLTWYIASTSNRVLHEVACDVLVIRPG